MARPVDVPERLRVLGDRYDLPGAAVGQLERLLVLLVEDPLAPTAIRSVEHALDDHIADSLVGLEVAELRAARRIVDLGSGAGLPGLPLAVARPEADIWLIDGVSRKCAFMARAVEVCGLRNVTVRHVRAEELAAQGERFELVTARALAALSVVAEYAAPLLELGGTLVAWRGQRDPQGEAEAEKAAEELGLAVGSIRRVFPYQQAESRYLHLMSKVMETPSGFPRRAGMAVKRPLGRRGGAGPQA